MSKKNEPTLSVHDLRTHFITKAGVVKAVDDVSFDVKAGEVMGLVGESGSGKSVTGFSIIGLIDPPGRVVSGSIKFKGEELVGASEDRMQKLRGNRIAMIFQDPMMTLNPVLRIGAQMMDAVIAHKTPLSKNDIEKRCRESLESVDLDGGVFQMYPHELSGGMKQRVCIAIGILLQPKVIVADEPTSALDVVTQRQVMETLDKVREQLGAAIILIGHDMGLMAQFVDKVAVLYAGQVMELSTVKEMFTDALHPYSEALINSLPNLENKGVFQGIPGLAPALLRLPPGCSFHPRCPKVMDHCRTERPETILQNGRTVSCHLFSQEENQAA